MMAFLRCGLIFIGHQHPHIDKAIIAQLGKVAHSTALGLANVPASKFAEKLIQTMPQGLNKVFFSDDGSTAVEVALKWRFNIGSIKISLRNKIYFFSKCLSR